MQKYWKYIFSLVPSFYFCLRVLPFSQAIKIPILVHKIKIYSLKGKVRIETNHISLGMIKLGFNLVPLYRDTGIMIQNNGIIIFKGKCTIGSGSSLSVEKNGLLIFGENFGASAEFRLTCNNRINFNKNVLFGYECLVMDNDLHRLTYLNGKSRKGFAPINIGEYNWFGARCTILKNTETPSYCTIAACSILSKSYSNIGEYKVLGINGGMRVLKDGVYRDPENDSIFQQ